MQFLSLEIAEFFFFEILKLLLHLARNVFLNFVEM